MRLPHTVTLVRAGTKTDTRNNTKDDWSAAVRTDMRGWVQPLGSQELIEAADTQIGDWRLFTLDSLTGHDRVEWSGHSFDVIGPARPFTDRLGNVHHYETSLREVTGA